MTELSPLEVAAGNVFGLDATLGQLPPAMPSLSPRQVLESVVERALRRAPCIVSFSGGRDSSAVLAVATHVARREGLPLPVPVSLRFPECATSIETDWQELVVRELGLPDWERPQFTDEMDLVGPIAADVLRRKGLLWPFNTYFHVPIIQRARGGSVLTGIGGDELYSGTVWQRENLLLNRRVKVRPLDPIRVAVALGPRPLRRAFLELRYRARRTPAWLLPDAAKAVRSAGMQMRALETLSFSSTIERVWWRRRSRAVGLRSMAAIAGDYDVEVTAPLADPAFLAQVLADRGWRVFHNRAAAMAELVGDLLPDRLNSRSTKAWFDDAFFNRHSRAFAADWDGQGVAADIVDVPALRTVWTDPKARDARSYLLLQSLWLGSQGAVPPVS